MDENSLRDYSKRVFGALGGAMTAALIHLGDRLGLYRALADGAALGSAELAAKTGLSERWLREWLFQQAAAGLLEHHGGERFALPPEGAAVLADEQHAAFGAGFFAHLPQSFALVEHLPESFRSGLGLPYDALGESGAEGIERGFAPWLRNFLIPLLLPRLPGSVERLRAGCAVLDIGCGAGAALIELARAFPASEFHGYEISQHALARAEANRASVGASNVQFHDLRCEPLPSDPRFALALAFDCLHDMTQPQQVMRAVRRSLEAEGCWLISEIKAQPGWQANTERNPMAALMYGTSLLHCMSSGLSEPGGLGLGALGLHAELLRDLGAAAGFTRFEPLDVPHPVNAFYALRP